MDKSTTAMIIASQNQDYVDEGLAEYQDQIHKLQSKCDPALIFKQAGKNSMNIGKFFAVQR